MSTRHIVVVPYDEKWKQAFEDIKCELEAALGNLALRIEHVGSTSVEGLSAKPIIDIDVVIRNPSMLDSVIEALAKIGYRHEGDKGIPGREAFKYDGKEHLMIHHLYVCSEDAAELKRHLGFRDYLRSHPETVKEYGRVKEEGAKLYPYDIDKYIEHKSPFIESIYDIISEKSNGQNT
ncbi:MAG: GrpB family protein [Lachnospiraceae bacterium]|nr:GrpB family protein [Lachnospiraceae bacterium]